MIEKQEVKPGGRQATPEERAVAVVRAILDDSTAQEARITSTVMEAIATVIADERRSCARILDAIKDEFIDWCAINHISSSEEVQIANMLRGAAASIRNQMR